MNWPDNQRPCAWVIERIEPYLDGDLSPDDTSVTDAHLAQCSDCAYELEMAQRVARSLRAMPAMTCPDHVVDRVYEVTRAPRGRWLENWLSSLRRPALVGAMAVALVAVVTLVGLQWQRPSVVSAEEIARAETEAKLAFALVRDISLRATATMQEEVLRQRVASPMRRAMMNSIRIKTPNPVGEDDNAG